MEENLKNSRSVLQRRDMKVCDKKEQMFEVNTERIDTGVMGGVSQKNSSKIESKKFH